ncbi:integrase, catalytic region, zinc finger, CCHC-type containing protein [Tanacetum coccineum]
MSDVIPFEVQMEIVKRVYDVSSLIRFRSVSKEWKSFIDSHEFIAGYGFRHTQPSRFMLRYLHYQEDENEDDLLDEFGEIIRTGLIWFSELEKYICFVDNDDSFALKHDFPPFVVVPDFIQQLNRDKIVRSSWESLVVSAHINMVTKKVCGVWMMVMEDDGNVASFKKLFNIDTFNTSVDKMLGFLKRGELLLKSCQELEESDLSALYLAI